MPSLSPLQPEPFASLVPLNRLIDASGIAERFGISRQLVSNWQKRYEDFPKPLDLPQCRGNRLWDALSVQCWMDERTEITVTTLRTLKTDPSRPTSGEPHA